MPTPNTYLFPGLRTSRLVFRLLREDDFALCLPFFKHPLSHRYWDAAGKDPLTLCTEWFSKQQWRYVSHRGGAMAVTDKATGTLYGWCGLLLQEVDGKQELEVGYSLLPEHWGKGIATEAAGACLAAAFENNLAGSVISIIQVDNMPSRRVATKIGMVIDRQTTYHGNPVWIYRIDQGRHTPWTDGKLITK